MIKNTYKKYANLSPALYTTCCCWSAEKCCFFVSSNCRSVHGSTLYLIIDKGKDATLRSYLTIMSVNGGGGKGTSIFGMINLLSIPKIAYRQFEVWKILRQYLSLHTPNDRHYINIHRN